MTQPGVIEELQARFPDAGIRPQPVHDEVPTADQG